MSLGTHYKANFNTMLLAAENKDLALLDCRDKETGKQVHVVCAIYRDNEGQFNMVPLAKLFDGNPYDEVDPPNPEGGYHP